MRIFLAFLCLFSLVYAANYFELVDQIDGWEDMDPILLSLDEPLSFPISVEASVSSLAAFGGERDIQIMAVEGKMDAISFGRVKDNVFSFSAMEMSGTLLIQYDGEDGSAELQFHSLSLDLTLNEGDRLKLRVKCDKTTTSEIAFRSELGVSIYDIKFTKGDYFQDYYALFSDFEGEADLHAIEAIEVMIPFDNTLSFSISDFFIMRDININTVVISPVDFHYEPCSSENNKNVIYNSQKPTRIPSPRVLQVVPSSHSSDYSDIKPKTSFQADPVKPPSPNKKSYSFVMPTPMCREYVGPIEDKYIDFGIGCARNARYLDD